ncbi:acyl-CoA dehydrogenase family protein [Streptomyces sp. NPDC058067]|uniref:acyl-CoA dehydrogenase family protein n=1 Tax=Streptomyces sp. NPDC058067 TaxID=3346324 RepID=UPI0036E1DBA0
MSEFAVQLRTLIDDLVSAEGGTAGDVDPLRLWERLRELGLHRVGLPEERGGSGGSLDDRVVVVEALASRGVGVPIVEASVADWVVGHAQPLDDRLTTVVLLDTSTAPTDRGPGLPVVPWGRHAQRLVLCAPGRPAQAVDMAGAVVEPGENLAGEPRDVVTLTGEAPAELAGAPSYDAVRQRLGLLWSAAVVGAAQGAYRLTKAYVAERRQFGVPLLEIPAVASGIAQMRVGLAQAETALALAREAVAAEGETPADVNVSESAVATARIMTAAAATDIARLAHQLHGAMGVTHEYPLHHCTRRLWAWRDSVAAERQWAEELGRQAAAAGEHGVWTRLTATAY